MPPRLLVDALGTTVELDLTGASEALDAEVRLAWRDAETADAVAGPPEHTIVVADRTRASNEQVLAELSQRVTLAAIEARKGELWMLHATGLALPDGRVIAFVGPSGRGKTTAARALGTRYGYVTDETVGIDLSTGRVLPYRKPLSIIEKPGHKTQRAPSSLGLAPPPPRDLHLAAVVVLDRRDDAPLEPVVDELDLGDVLDELVSQTSHLTALPNPLQSIAAFLSKLGGVRRVTYREAESIIELVEPLAITGEAMPWHPVEVGASTMAGYTRTGVIDAIELDDPDRLIVLQLDHAGVGTVRLLGGIAPALWSAADGASRADLVAAAVARHGRPDGVDVEAAVDAAVAELESVGLVINRIRHD
jgi:hypothetical protein